MAVFDLGLYYILEYRIQSHMTMKDKEARRNSDQVHTHLTANTYNRKPIQPQNAF